MRTFNELQAISKDKQLRNYLNSKKICLTCEGKGWIYNDCGYCPVDYHLCQRRPCPEARIPCPDCKGGRDL